MVVNQVGMCSSFHFKEGEMLCIKFTVVTVFVLRDPDGDHVTLVLAQ